MSPSSGCPLPLDELYLDTTFCSPLYRTFPTRYDGEHLDVTKPCVQGGGSGEDLAPGQEVGHQEWHVQGYKVGPKEGDGYVHYT